MELWRRAQGPWGQDMVVGVSWDLMWLAIFVAALFLVAHAAWVWGRGRAGGATEGDPEPDPSAEGLPERVTRHSAASRIFHWTMSASMLALLVTAFGPVLGWRFPWLTIHWVSGVVLLGTVLFHIVHALGRGRFREMMRIGLSEGMAMMRHAASSKAPPPPKAGKYPFDHRLFHHAIVVVGMGVIVTGVLMTFRIDTWFWDANPYFLLSDGLWSVVYVVHGLCGVALIFLTAAHIYFALRPDKLWLTWAMVRGWIDRDRFVEHYDPDKWVVPGAGSQERSPADGSG